eukprot:gene20817-7713_t
MSSSKSQKATKTEIERMQTEREQRKLLIRWMNSNNITKFPFDKTEIAAGSFVRV